jgi:hypothetical protein
LYSLRASTRVGVACVPSTATNWRSSTLVGVGVDRQAAGGRGGGGALDRGRHAEELPGLRVGVAVGQADAVGIDLGAQGSVAVEVNGPRGQRGRPDLVPDGPAQALAAGRGRVLEEVAVGVLHLAWHAKAVVVAVGSGQRSRRSGGSDVAGHGGDVAEVVEAGAVAGVVGDVGDVAGDRVVERAVDLDHAAQPVVVAGAGAHLGDDGAVDVAAAAGLDPGPGQEGGGMERLDLDDGVAREDPRRGLGDGARAVVDADGLAGASRRRITGRGVGAGRGGERLEVVVVADEAAQAAVRVGAVGGDRADLIRRAGAVAGDGVAGVD